MLDASEASVNSALQRARAAMAAAAYTSDDVDAIIALLTDDAWFTMPPTTLEYHGHAAVGEFLRESASWRGGRPYRLVPTRANGQPAFGVYLPVGEVYRTHGLVVLTLRGDRIRAITRFVDTAVTGRFGLPRVLLEHRRGDPGGRRAHLARRHQVHRRRPARITARIVTLCGAWGIDPRMTGEQIREARPGWDLWRDGVITGGDGHRGETLQQVAARADAVLDRVRSLLDQGDVALIGHGHLQRVLTARWLGLHPSAARLLGHPHTGTLSTLGYEHEQTVISAWNVVPWRLPEKCCLRSAA